MLSFLNFPCQEPDANCKKPKVFCKQMASDAAFGLCDDPPPDKFPAYIQKFRPDEWIATVINPNGEDITFKALDNCVPILRTNGNEERRCDGILIHKKNLHFVELKNASYQGWVGEAIDQILVSITHFVRDAKIADFNISDAYICNKQRPMTVMGVSSEMERFKHETANLLFNNGLKLIVDRSIKF